MELWGGGARGSDGSSDIYIGSGGGYGFAFIDVVPGMTCYITVGSGASFRWSSGGTTSITCGSTYYYAEGGRITTSDPLDPCIGGSSNAPFHIQGQKCGYYGGTLSATIFGYGGSAGRGGFGTKEVGRWPGGGGAEGGAPGGVVIYY